MSGAGLIELLAARLGGRGARRAAPALREVLAAAIPERAPVTAHEPIASRLDDPMADGAMQSRSAQHRIGEDGERIYDLRAGNRDYEVTLAPHDDRGFVGVNFNRRGAVTTDDVSKYDATGDASPSEALAAMRAIRDLMERDAREFGPNAYGWSSQTREQRQMYDAMLSRYGAPEGYEVTGQFPQVRRVAGESSISTGPDARPAQGGRRSPYQEELRAQGFDVESPLYRGMTRQAEGGDFTRNADLQGSEQFHGTSFSRSTSEANLYAMEGDGGAVYPAYMRGRLESGPDYMRAVQARARESGVTNQEAARQVQQEYAQRGVTGVEWPPDRYGKGGEVRIFDQSNTASPFGANAPRTAPDGRPVQAGRIPSSMRIEIQQPPGQSGSRYRLELDNQKNGFITVTDDGDVWRVNNSHLDPDLRNQGHGVRLYEDLVLRAREAGARTLRSDNSVSTEAQNAWMGLQRRGYPVTRIETPDGPRFEVDLARTGPNAGSDRNALQRALRDRMNRE